MKRTGSRIVQAQVRGGWPQHASRSNYWFCHVTSEQLLKVIEYLYSVNIQKASIVAGLSCRKLWR